MSYGPDTLRFPAQASARSKLHVPAIGLLTVAFSPLTVTDAQDESKQPQCCLCPVEGGALKPTTEPGLWCHATCLQWIPEVSVGDDRRMEPVTHIKSIQKERWELNCCICK